MYSSHKSTLHCLTLSLHGIAIQKVDVKDNPLHVFTRAMIELCQKNLPAFDFFDPVAKSYGACDEDMVPEDEATFVTVDPITTDLDADDMERLQNTIKPHYAQAPTMALT